MFPQQALLTQAFPAPSKTILSGLMNAPPKSDVVCGSPGPSNLLTEFDEKLVT